MQELWYSPSSEAVRGALGDQEREDSVKPHFTYIPGGLYTAPQAGLSLAGALSLDGD